MASPPRGQMNQGTAKGVYPGTAQGCGYQQGYHQQGCGYKQGYQQQGRQYEQWSYGPTNPGHGGCLGRIFRITAPSNRGMIGAGTGIISGTTFAHVYS